MSHKHHSDTSKAAYDSVKDLLPSIELRIVEHVARVGNATCDECEVALGLSHQTCSAAFTKLVDSEQVFVTAMRRKTRSGRSARVYTTVRPAAAPPPPSNYEFPF